MKLAIINIGICILCFSTNLFGQEVISANGGMSELPSGKQVEWTVGEVVTETIISESNNLTQGFHQGNISVLSILKNTNLKIELYPNPTTNYLSLQCPTEYQPTVEIMNSLGEVLYKDEHLSGLSQIEMSSYAKGLYFVKVYINQKDFKFFEIIKL